MRQQQRVYRMMLAKARARTWPLCSTKSRVVKLLLPICSSCLSTSSVSNGNAACCFDEGCFDGLSVLLRFLLLLPFCLLPGLVGHGESVQTRAGARRIWENQGRRRGLPP